MSRAWLGNPVNLAGVPTLLMAPGHGRTDRALQDRGMTPMIGTPAEFAKVFASDVDKWRNVIQGAGIKLE